MLIRKILNNNVAIVAGASGEDTVVMGRGLGFGRKAGDTVPQEAVERTFLLQDPALLGRFQQLIASIPPQHFQLCERIISYAKTVLTKQLSDSIHITLADHISGAITRYEQQINLPNPLLWDIKQLYRDEFMVGQKALSVVQQELGILFSEDEAGFIALHFVNAELGGELRTVYDMTYLMQDIFQIVRREFQFEPDEQSLDYYRFVTHLKFFVQRIIANQHYGNEDADLLELIRKKYDAAFRCAQKICCYIEQKNGYQAGKNELLYLTIHIARITLPPDTD